MLYTNFFVYEDFLPAVRQKLPLFTKNRQVRLWEEKLLSIFYFVLLTGFFMA